MRSKLSIFDMHRIDADTFKASDKLPLVVVLDNIRSMNNIGSIFRTADAFRLEGLMLCGITATPPHPMIHKTALGAEEVVTWQYIEHTATAIEQLKASGYRIIALEQATESITPQALSLNDSTQKVALIVGNEVHGVDADVVAQADACMEIPQLGTKHSLNVSVATGIAIYSLIGNLLPDYQ